MIQQNHRVAFYTRISLDEEKQKYSLGAQKERLEAFCISQYGDEWQLFKAYRDTESGTHLRRPGLQEMLADARDGAFDILLVFRVDRLSRKVHELAQLVDEFLKLQVTLRSITEPFDTSNPAGKMMLQMLGVFAEFEHSTIIERTKTGMLKKAKTGKWPGGRVPLGYSYNAEAGLQINEPEAAIIRRIFELYTQGNEGSSAIARQLNAAGHRMPTGKKFGRKAVLLILRNPFYLGRFRWQGQTFPGEHEAIVSEETFARAAEILQGRSEDQAGRRWHNQDEHLLGGLVRCSRCKATMSGVSTRKNGGKILYYACRTRLDSGECDQDYVRADWIEGRILSEVQTIFRDEALLTEIWAEAEKKLAAELPDADADRRRLEAERTKVQAGLDRYFAAFEMGTMAPSVCRERVDALTAQIRQLDAELVAQEGRRQALSLPELKMDFLEQILTNLEGIVAAVPRAEKKHLLRLLVEKVLVRDRSEVEIWYKLPQSTPVRTLSPLVAPTGVEPVLPP